jgi:hypothetical protein
LWFNKVNKLVASMRALPIAILGLFWGTLSALAFDCTALTGATIPKSAIGLPASGTCVMP